MTGEVVNDAIFSRNLLTEDTLDIRIEPVWAGDEEFQSSIRNGVIAGATDFDAAQALNY